MYPERELNAENKIGKGPIEFAFMALPVPQVAGDSVVHDDLFCLHCLPRGDLKTVPTD